MKVNEPKITVNKLGEFLVAPAARQRRILEQLKYPKDNKFGATAHTEAREALKEYFISGFDKTILSDCIQALKDKKGLTDYMQKVNNSSIEMLEGVLEINSDYFSGYSYYKYQGNNEKMMINGVEISVYPDLMVEYTYRDKDYIGAFKLHLSKSSNFGKEGGNYIAVLLNHYTSEFIIPENKVVKPSCSISYDVPKGDFIKCPASTAVRWNDIKAGCKTISDIWDSI